LPLSRVQRAGMAREESMGEPPGAPLPVGEEECPALPARESGEKTLERSQVFEQKFPPSWGFFEPEGFELPAAMAWNFLGLFLGDNC